MNLFKYIGLNLGVLSMIATVPIQKPEVNTKTYESHLFLEMVGNWEEEHEQEAVEESLEHDSQCGEVCEETGQAVQEQTVVEDGTEVAPETESIQTVAVAPLYTPLYTVNGQLLDEGIQNYLYQRLAEAGIPWFMPYAILIAYQESSFNIYAQNPNGLDKGLFQFRITYWGAGDIFNPYTQIDVFVGLMANRANNLGCTVSDMISRHNQSDYGQYCQSYVDAVMGWAGSLVQVR